MTGAVKPKILVTRPQPGADQTARRLSGLGIEPLVLPFTEMVKLVHRLDDAVLKNADAVVVTSANALRHADKRMLNKLKHLPVFTVGDATKDAALDKGLSNVVSANGDAHDLSGLVTERLKPNSSIVYLCGKTRTDDIEMNFAKAGFKIWSVETYQTIKVSQLTYKLGQLMEHHTLDGVLLYSGISAHIYSEVWSDRTAGKSIAIPMSFCISERAKATLSPALQSQVIVCSQPRDDVMIETVDTYFRSKN